MVQEQVSLRETVWSRAWRDLWAFVDRPYVRMVVLFLDALVAAAGAGLVPDVTKAERAAVAVGALLLVPLIGGGLLFLVLLPFALRHQRDEARERLLRFQENGLSDADQALISSLQELVCDLQNFFGAETKDAALDQESFMSKYRDGLRPRVFWMADRLLGRGFIQQETRDDLIRARNPHNAQYALVILSERLKWMRLPEV